MFEYQTFLEKKQLAFKNILITECDECVRSVGENILRELFDRADRAKQGLRVIPRAKYSFGQTQQMISLEFDHMTNHRREIKQNQDCFELRCREKSAG